MHFHITITDLVVRIFWLWLSFSAKKCLLNRCLQTKKDTDLQYALSKI